MGGFYGTKKKKVVGNTVEPDVRTFKLPGNKIVKAKRVVVPFSDFQNYELGNLDSSAVHIHKLNPRAQERLDRDALSDILPFVETSGVTFEGIAEEDNGKYLLLDSSRRFACARIVGCDLPLFVFDKADNLNKEQAKYIAELCRTSRPLSYREEGMLLLSELTENNEIDTIEKVMAEFRYKESQKKTVERYIDAAMISENLINLFPDPEGIPNDFYAKLKSFSKSFAKKHDIKPEKNETQWQFFKRLNIDLDDFVSKSNIEVNFEELDDIKAKHTAVFREIEDLFDEPKDIKPTWSEPEYLHQKSKYNYVNVSRHKNGRDLRINAKRLTKEQEQQLFDLIQSFN